MGDVWAHPPAAGPRDIHSSLDDQRLHLMQLAYSLKRGGSERVAVDLSLGLDASRVRSSMCALAYSGELAHELTSAGIPVHVIGRRSGFDWSVIPRLYQVFRENRADVVQTHHFVSLLYGAVGARLAGAAVVHVEHDYYSLQRPWIKRCFRLLAPLCSAIIAVGDQVREFLVKEVGLSPAKVRVIRNGVDVDRYSPGRRVPRTTLGLPPDGRLIGHVGRLVPEKDQGTLLRAFRTVLSACTDVRLVIVGEGWKLRDLQQTAASLGITAHVHFLGLQENVNNLLPHLDVFALPSLNEGLPLALLEAMACGRPVIATAVGEIPQVIHEGVTGLIVPPDDPTALAASIRAILDRPGWALEMGRSARQLIEETFSLSLMIRQYQDVYDSLRRANHSRRPRAQNEQN